MNIDDKDVLDMATAFLHANDCHDSTAYLIEMDDSTAVTIHYRYSRGESMWTITMLDFMAFVWRQRK